MSDASAWMVGFRGDRRAAVGNLELVHVLPDRPVLHRVLEAPAHCRHVFLWQERVLPVFDVSHWLGEAPDEGEAAHLGVFRYRPAPDAGLHYGSLVIDGAPRQVLVNDSQACELPSGGESWRAIAHACFDCGGRAVPVLNLARIFCGPR